MYMRDGLHLSGKGAAVFADELSAAGVGNITMFLVVNIAQTRSAVGVLRGASSRTRGQ